MGFDLSDFLHLTFGSPEHVEETVAYRISLFFCFPMVFKNLAHAFWIFFFFYFPAFIFLFQILSLLSPSGSVLMPLPTASPVWNAAQVS